MLVSRDVSTTADQISVIEYLTINGERGPIAVIKDVSMLVNDLALVRKTVLNEMER